MKTPDVSGYWAGEIFGTNKGGFTLDMKQEGEKLSGVAKIFEPAMGQYEYNVARTPIINSIYPWSGSGDM